MTSSIDLDLLPLYMPAGKDSPIIPGVYISDGPRRPARGRRFDQLILYFEMVGNAPVSLVQKRKILERVAQTFYKTSGTVTSAMQTVAEGLNKFLLDRNLRGGSSGHKGSGLLTMGVLRRDRILLGHCGEVSTFSITSQGVEHLYESHPVGRGLGLGRTTPISFFHVNLKPRDTLVFVNRPSASWTETVLQDLKNLSLESMRLSLINKINPEENAILIQAKEGTGKIVFRGPKAKVSRKKASAEKKTEPAPSDGVQGKQAVSPQVKDVTAAGQLRKGAAGSDQQRQVASAPATRPAAKDDEIVVETEKHVEQVKAEDSSVQTGQKRSIMAPLLRASAVILRAFSNSVSRLLRAFGVLLRRILPGEGMLTLPSSVMILVAVAVPLVVVGISTVIYYQQGRTGQYEQFYSLAYQTAEQASVQTDADLQREGWKAVIGYLDKAEEYEITADSQNLRNQARLIFDGLDGVIRLDFQPALSEDLPQSTVVTRIAAASNEIFMLDTNSGDVRRAISINRGYQLDDAFQCGPSFFSDRGIGKIIDIAIAPRGSEPYVTLLGMDNNGNLITCIPGEQTTSLTLAPPPSNWAEPRAFTIENGHLYVLDPKTNAVWIYWGRKYDEQPQLFFADQVPPMEDVIDLAVDNNDLYLLHSDGHTTICTFSDVEVSPTHCIDPLPYVDSRSGRENQPFLSEYTFNQISAIDPPDPSLYFLEPENLALYLFSLRTLTFHRQYRPLDNAVLDQTQTATAFALNQDIRIAFLAAGNRVYYAGIP